jgi:protoheme IX farnesyltransferase
MTTTGTFQFEKASPRDYYEITKPGIVQLLVFVAVVSMVVARGFSVPPIPFGFLIIAGALSSAGCGAVNCYLDKDIDAKMDRTSGRSTVNGRINPPEKALYFGIALIAVSLTISFFLINLLTTLFISLGALFYLGVYTLGLKRRHYSNIIIGGFAGSFPALAGWAAVTTQSSLQAYSPAIFIAILVFIWTPAHFWSLALKYREDYNRTKMPMLPVVKGEKFTINAIAASSLLVAVYSLVPVAFPSIFLFGYVYDTFAGILAGLQIWVAVKLLRNPTKSMAWTSFKFSLFYLTLMLAAMVADKLVQSIPL